MPEANPRIVAMARFAPTRAAAAALYDGVSGTSVAASPSGVVAGTLIASEVGAVAVDELRAGDLLASGHRITSVAHRTLDADALARDADARPVLIDAGALAENVPARALALAPGQLLFIGDQAVPAAALVNGASITRQRPDRTVTYMRLRLDGPSAFMAEGVACDGFDARVSDAGAIGRIRSAVDARAGLVRGPVDGDVGACDRRGAMGWALDAAHPSAPVPLEFVVGGTVMAHALADIRRPDLEIAGLGEGRCGFRVHLRRPLPADRHAVVEVRRLGDAADLPGTPLLLPRAVGRPAEFGAALKQETAAAANETKRLALAALLARAIDRLLQVRGERPPAPPAAAAD